MHQEWRLEIGLMCNMDSTRLTAVLINHEVGQLHHVRPSPEAATAATYGMDFFPHDWDHADDVRINAMGTAVSVHSRGLTREPNRLATPLVEVGEVLSTGIVADLVDLGGTRWMAQVALLGESDTNKDRTRWHLSLFWW